MGLSDYSVIYTTDYTLSYYYDFEKRKILLCSNTGGLLAFAAFNFKLKPHAEHDDGKEIQIEHPNK